MNCPECGSPIEDRDDGYRPECCECGFVLYSDYDRSVMAEARRDYERAKADCYPEPVPDDYSSREAVNERLVEAWRLKQ